LTPQPGLEDNVQGAIDTELLPQLQQLQLALAQEQERLQQSKAAMLRATWRQTIPALPALLERYADQWPLLSAELPGTSACKGCAARHRLGGLALQIVQHGPQFRGYMGAWCMQGIGGPRGIASHQLPTGQHLHQAALGEMVAGHEFGHERNASDGIELQRVEQTMAAGNRDGRVQPQLDG